MAPTSAPNGAAPSDRVPTRRIGASIALVLAVLAAVGCGAGGESADAPAWTIDLADVAIGPTGIGVALHPTRAPIALSADAGAPLQMCPADGVGRPSGVTLSSWGRRWTECRPLGKSVISLPPADGRSHVGIRILAADRSATTIRRLRVRWTCQDPYFVFQDPAGRPPPPVPACPY